MSNAKICTMCEGCGRVANDDHQTAWKHWEELALESSGAVLAGLIKPVECPQCNGSGSLEAEVSA